MRNAREPLTDDMLRFFNAMYPSNAQDLEGVWEGCEHVTRSDNGILKIPIGGKCIHIGNKRMLILCESCYARIIYECLSDILSRAFKELMRKGYTKRAIGEYLKIDQVD